MNIELLIYVHILVTSEGKKNKNSVSSRFPVSSSTLSYVCYMTDVPASEHVVHILHHFCTLLEMLFKF